MKALKAKILQWLYGARFPSIWMYAHPFRIIEYFQVLKGVAVRKSDRVLDIGCGAGLQTYCLGARAGEAIGIDLVDPRHANAEQHRVKGRISVKFLNSRLQDCRFAPESFDKIFSFCVLEHIPEYEEILQICHQILKTGGSLHFSADALATVSDGPLLARHKADHQVAHYFTPAQITEKLKQAGFSEVRVAYLFRSRLSTRIFESGIRSRFSYRLMESWRLAAGMWMAEIFTRRNAPGLFIVAHAHKNATA